MGYMTIEEITQEVALNTGGAVVDPVRLLRWVNWGVLNLASFVLLDELVTTAAFAIAEDATELTTPPTDLLGVVTLTCWDASLTDIVYLKMQKMRREYYPATENGHPSHYKRRGSTFVTWPEADADYTGEIEYVKIPAKITVLTGTTEFTADWDVAIVMLTTHYGLTALRQHDEADRWLGRFLGYKASRMTDVDISADVPKGGLDVAWDHSDITDDPPYLED